MSNSDEYEEKFGGKIRYPILLLKVVKLAFSDWKMS